MKTPHVRKNLMLQPSCAECGASALPPAGERPNAKPGIAARNKTVSRSPTVLLLA